MPNSEIYELEIAADQLADADQFEADRRAAYEAKGDERTEHLQGLVEAAHLAGDLALYDVLLEKLTHNPSADEQLDEAEKRLAEVSEKVASLDTHRGHKGLTYRILLGHDGTVQGVSRLEVVPEDKKATSRNKDVAKRIGWGPANNDSSFRGSVVDPSKIRPH